MPDSITVAYALGMGEVKLLGKIGTTKADIDHLCKRLHRPQKPFGLDFERL
ncbi:MULTISPECIES: hypothetical protein [Burkholderiaceae]|uniref:hypothetical protein n=1 Tax=Burkholderiaceae TaxID=119060 RepID=UPI00158AD87B|nr:MULTISPECIES: hypothetical protein [Burkholderiaceae]MCG1018750.1 hypothetical protein [Mycetohabitans sp. B4]